MCNSETSFSFRDTTHGCDALIRRSRITGTRALPGIQRRLRLTCVSDGALAHSGRSPHIAASRQSSGGTMARASAEAKEPVAEGAAELAIRAEELTSRLVGGMNRLFGQASRSAQRVKDAAQDLRTSTVLQHAAAARERGNLQAALWLLNEEFNLRSDDESVAVPYWEIALALGRVDIASPAGVKLVEARAAAGESELAAQHWLELVKEAPDALVSPVAIATILPALKARLARSSDDGPDDRSALAGYLQSGRATRRRPAQHRAPPGRRAANLRRRTRDQPGSLSPRRRSRARVQAPA